VVDAAAQRATFAGALADAIAAGYTGIRVAADNTPLVGDEERLDAWMRWESVADGFISQHPVTASFDRERVQVDRLRHVATLHPLVSATSPVPQFRIFVDDEALRVEGLIDGSAVDELARVLSILPPKTPLVIDLRDARLMSTRALGALAELGETGIDVTVQGPPEAVDEARRAAETFENEHFHFAED
jgi:hypothetical protein